MVESKKKYEEMLAKAERERKEERVLAEGQMDEQNKKL